MTVRSFLDEAETAEADQEFTHRGGTDADLAGKLQFAIQRPGLAPLSGCAS